MTDKQGIDWVAASKSFDGVAIGYDRFRPSYPPALIESILSLAPLPPMPKLLEIGCGTGKATLLFAKKGCSIHCIEPGVQLAQLAAKRLEGFHGITFESVRFEEWREQAGAFDLVFSAQAFHWVPADVGYKKASLALKPGGSLALFWNMYPGMEGPLAQELRQVYRERAPELCDSKEDLEETVRQRELSMRTSGCFGAVTIRRFPWSIRYTTSDYLGLLATYSDHLLLPEKTLSHLLDGVAQAIDRSGGWIERPYLSVLYIAKRT